MEILKIELPRIDHLYVRSGVDDPFVEHLNIILRDFPNEYSLLPIHLPEDTHIIVISSDIKEIKDILDLNEYDPIIISVNKWIEGLKSYSQPSIYNHYERENEMLYLISSTNPDISGVFLISSLLRLNIVQKGYDRKEIKLLLEFFDEILTIYETGEEDYTSFIDKIGLISLMVDLAYLIQNFNLVFTKIDQLIGSYSPKTEFIELSDVIYKACIIKYEINDIEGLKQYLVRLKLLSDMHQDKLIKLKKDIVNALILKNGARAVEKVQAQELFSKLAREEIYDINVTRFALLNLCDLLILELKAYGKEEEVMKEINEILELLDRLSVRASQSFYQDTEVSKFKIDTNLLRSKVAMINFDFEKAKKFMENAKKEALSSKNRFLRKKVDKQDKEFSIEIEKFKDYRDKNYTVIERMERTSLSKYMKEMLKFIETSRFSSS